jgi:hypothetical protein
MLKNEPHPKADILRHNRQVSKSGAEMAMEKDNAQMLKAIVKAKKILLVDEYGFIYKIYIPKNALPAHARLKITEKITGILMLISFFNALINISRDRQENFIVCSGFLINGNN